MADLCLGQDMKSLSVLSLLNMNAQFQQQMWHSLVSQNFTAVLFLFALLIGLYFLWVVIKFLGRMFLLFYDAKQPHTLFEVKPLRTTEQSAYTTQQLFTQIHGLSKEQSLLQRLFNVGSSFAFEIVSTKEQGIRYLMRLPESDAELMKKTLLSYLPGLSVEETQDYVSQLPQNAQTKIIDLKLAKHFALPLKKLDSLEEYDPIAYITGNMTKLSDQEVVAFQVIVSPVQKETLPEIQELSQVMYQNKDLVHHVRHHTHSNLLLKILKSLLFITLHVLFFPLGVAIFILTQGKDGPFLKLPFEHTPNKTSNPYQIELEKQIKDKLDQELCRVSLRFLVSGSDHHVIQERVHGLFSALSSFHNAQYQKLVTVKTVPWFKQLKEQQFVLRMLSLFHSSILSVTEVADLYHFPFTSTTKTENLVKLQSRQLPPPLSLKKTQHLDITFAKNTYGGSSTLIGLTEDERRRHMYILGATGTGKSTLLLSMITQDLQHNKGLCVIDPHGDLIENVLQTIPDHRLNDVVYFNPDDISYPIGLNLLELPDSADAEFLVREKELVTESIISLFHKLYSDRNTGPRMEYILRNTIHTAFSTEHPTLFTVYKLLTNGPFRTHVVSQLTDENLIDFWKHEFSKAGDYQKVSMIMPITNKIGRFLFSSTAKCILEQERSTLHIDDLMDQGRILLCNLSKGKIGEDTSEVLGILILTKIQLAALKRARTTSETRRDFYIYVDEFQNFATPAFAQILSEARKYKLNAILAHQTTSQVEDHSLVNVTLANTGTVICFRTANPEDEKVILPQFAPLIQKGEIANLPSFHFYMKIAALEPEEPFSGETIPVEVQPNAEKVAQVIQYSREQFAMKYAEKTAEPLVKQKKEPKKKIQKIPVKKTLF